MRDTLLFMSCLMKNLNTAQWDVPNFFIIDKKRGKNDHFTFVLGTSLLVESVGDRTLGDGGKS